MKNIKKEKAENLIRYFGTSAYIHSNELRDYACEILEISENFDEMNTQEFEEFEEKMCPVEDEIREYCEEFFLSEYEFIELEYQGDYHRYIYHEDK